MADFITFAETQKCKTFGVVFIFYFIKQMSILKNKLVFNLTSNNNFAFRTCVFSISQLILLVLKVRSNDVSVFLFATFLCPD